MTGLTDRQAGVLLFIRTSIADRGYPPTMREIAAAMGIRSTNGVNDHLRALERKGYISRENMKSRGLRVLGDAPPTAAPAEERAKVVVEANGKARHDGLTLAEMLRGILVDYQVIAVRRKDGTVVVDLAGEVARRMMDREAVL